MARSVPSLFTQGVAVGGVSSLLVASGPLLPLAAVAVVVAGAVLTGPRDRQEGPSASPLAPMFTPQEEAALKAFAARLDAAPDDAARRALGEEWLPGH